MSTRLTVIIDNIPSAPLCGEWGLAILAEHRGNRILIDTGASGRFADNMRLLGLDIGDVDYGVLSHAHYDHANGMPVFFRENSRAKFYLRESAAENCYAKKFIFRKYIGLPRNVMADYKDRIEIVSGDYELCDGAFLIPHKTPGLEGIGKREMMYQRTPAGFKPDNFSHEQSLVLDTDKGLVVINSCSHGGVVNIINEIKETFPQKHVHALIGGFHLFNKPEAEVRALAGEIKRTGIEYVCTGHCTMGKAYGILNEELGNMVAQLKSGLVIDF